MLLFNFSLRSPRSSSRNKIWLIISISVCMKLWHHGRMSSLEVPKPKLKYDTCQWKFNEEFSYSPKLTLFAPFSVFHDESFVTIIFSKDSNGKKAFVENFNSVNYYTTISWKIYFEQVPGEIKEVHCKPIWNYDPDPQVLVVRCKADGFLLAK